MADDTVCRTHTRPDTLSSAPPRGHTDYDLGALSSDQQRQLNDLKMTERRRDQIYLDQHPEVEAIVSVLVQAMMRDRPRHVASYAAKFFQTQPVMQLVDMYLDARCVPRAGKAQAADYGAKGIAQPVSEVEIQIGEGNPPSEKSWQIPALHDGEAILLEEMAELYVREAPLVCVATSSVLDVNESLLTEAPGLEKKLVPVLDDKLAPVLDDQEIAVLDGTHVPVIDFEAAS